MAFEDLDKGAKTNVHVRLYEAEIAILDALAVRYRTSRAAIVGELLRQNAGADLPEPERRFARART